MKQLDFNLKTLFKNWFFQSKINLSPKRELFRFLNFLVVLTMIMSSTFAQSPTSAMLDVAASNQGVLIPRINLTSNVDITTVPLPVVSLLIYNTQTVGVYPNNVSPGFYFWNGYMWKPLGGSMAFSEFFALMPGDNTATVAPGAAIEFPQNGLTDGFITRINASQFNLPSSGIYLVHWQVSLSEAAQLVISINGTELPNTLVGRATGTTQLVGHTMISTTIPNSVLTITNAIGNTPAITLTPTAGGTHAVSANLVITKIQ